MRIPRVSMYICTCGIAVHCSLSCSVDTYSCHCWLCCSRLHVLCGLISRQTRWNAATLRSCCTARVGVMPRGGEIASVCTYKRAHCMQCILGDNYLLLSTWCEPTEVMQLRKAVSSGKPTSPEAIAYVHIRSPLDRRFDILFVCDGSICDYSTPCL